MKTKPAKQKITDLEQLLGAVFVVLGIIAAFVPYFNFDLRISEYIQSINIAGFSQLMWLISIIGNSPTIIIIIGLVSLALIKASMHTEAYLAIVASLGSALVGTVAKIIIHRPRPEANIINVLVKLSDKSFPSNHVLIFTAFFGFLLYLSLYVFKNKLLKLSTASISSLLIITIGISRMYLGAHWASDVLGGYLLGTICLLVTIQIYRKATNT